jgi:hypothetical protein
MGFLLFVATYFFPFIQKLQTLSIWILSINFFCHKNIMSHFPNNQNTFGKHPPTGPPSDEEPPKKPTQDPPADGEDMETPTKPKKRRRNRHKKKATEKETEVSNTNPADPDSDSSSDSQLDEEGGVQLNDLQEETDGRSASHAFVEHDPPVISDDDAADILLQMSRAPPTDIQPVHLLPRPTRARNFDNATSVRGMLYVMFPLGYHANCCRTTPYHDLKKCA